MLLLDLINGGGSISLVNGHFVVKDINGVVREERFMRPIRKQLMEEVAEITGLSCYRYIDYTTGLVRGHSVGHLGIHFIDVLTGDSVVVYFNVNIKRARNTRNSKAGSSLPKGHFSAGERSAFSKFWRSTGLGMPRYSSEFHKVINRLNRLVFTGETERYIRQTGSELKFKSKQVPRLTLSGSQIISALNAWEKSGTSVGRLWEFGGNNVGEDNPPSPGASRVSDLSEPRVVQTANKVQCIESNERSRAEALDGDMEEIAREFRAEQSAEEWLKGYCEY